MTLQEMETATVIETLNGTEQDSMESWVREAPLKLVAWALDSMGRKGNSTAIKKNLKDLIEPDMAWDKWWTPVREALNSKETKEFSSGPKKNSFTLLASPDHVLAVPWNNLPSTAKKAKTQAPKLADWKRWMLSEDASPPPGPRPTKAVCTALAKLPAKDVAPALHRIMGSAAELLEGGSASSHVAAGWADAVSRGFVRFRELMPPDAVLSLAPQVGELLARLVKAAERSAGPTAQMISAGGLPLLPGTWLPGFAAGIWDGVQKSGGSARDLLEAPFPTVQDRSGLAREIVIAALDSAEPARQHRELDRILDCLPYREPVYFIRDLIVRSAARDVPRGAVLDYVADSRHAAGLPDSTERLDLLAMASLLLSNGSGEAVNKVAEQVGAALSGAADEQQTGPVWPALLSGARQHITDLRAQHAQELEEQRLSHEARLEEMRREVGQLNGRVEGLRAQIAESREESRMDIRQDMLLVMAETLQSLPEWAYNPETLVKNVEARLVLALGAGGAERLGTLGEIVPFDPRLHKSAKPIAIDSQVRVGVPGAIVRGKLTGGRVLTQARVVQFEGGE